MHEKFPLIKSKERGTNTKVALSRLDNIVVPMFSVVVSSLPLSSSSSADLLLGAIYGPLGRMYSPAGPDCGRTQRVDESNSVLIHKSYVLNGGESLRTCI